MTEADRRRVWTAVLFVAVASGGAALQARGALVPTFEVAFRVSEVQLGLLTPVATLGFVGPVVVVGVLAGRLPMRATVATGLALSGATLFLLGTASSFVSLLAFVGLRSAAVGLVRGLDRPILSRLYPESRGRVFTLEAMAWAVGATLGPVLATAALALGSWRLTYYALGTVFLAVAVVAWHAEFPTGAGTESAFTLADFRPLFDRPAVVGMSLTVILVGGIESTFFAWLPYYAADFLPRTAANVSLSAFLAAYVPGRFAFSRVADRYDPPDVVLGAAAALALLLAVLFGVGPMPTLPFLAGVFAAGFFVSACFPLLLTWGVTAVPEFTGPVNALAMVAGQVGFLVAPATVGVLAERFSIGTAMLVEVAMALALVVLLAGRRARRAVRA
ncbi:MAG: sugar MFS transporter [Halobacteriaceae archaeon]